MNRAGKIISWKWGNAFAWESERNQKEKEKAITEMRKLTSEKELWGWGWKTEEETEANKEKDQRLDAGKNGGRKRKLTCLRSRGGSRGETEGAGGLPLFSPTSTAPARLGTPAESIRSSERWWRRVNAIEGSESRFPVFILALLERCLESFCWLLLRFWLLFVSNLRNPSPSLGSPTEKSRGAEEEVFECSSCNSWISSSRLHRDNKERKHQQKHNGETNKEKTEEERKKNRKNTKTNMNDETRKRQQERKRMKTKQERHKPEAEKVWSSHTRALVCSWASLQDNVPNHAFWLQ